MDITDAITTNRPCQPPKDPTYAPIHTYESLQPDIIPDSTVHNTEDIISDLNPYPIEPPTKLRLRDSCNSLIQYWRHSNEKHVDSQSSNERFNRIIESQALHIIMAHNNIYPQTERQHSTKVMNSQCDCTLYTPRLTRLGKVMPESNPQQIIQCDCLSNRDSSNIFNATAMMQDDFSVYYLRFPSVHFGFTMQYALKQRRTFPHSPLLISMNRHSMNESSPTIVQDSVDRPAKLCQMKRVGKLHKL